MGKKAKLKQFRRIAATMPVIEGERIVTKRVMGAAVLLDGIEEVGGQPVDPKAIYRKREKEKVELNHTRKMKDLYNKGGIEGVNEYIRAVAQYEAAQKSEAA